jgi:hypothetical protein
MAWRGRVGSGTAEERAKALELSQNYLKSGPPDAEVLALRVELDDVSIRDLIGYKGAAVKELEQQTGACIRFSFDTRKVPPRMPHRACVHPEGTAAVSGSRVKGGGWWVVRGEG